MTTEELNKLLPKNDTHPEIKKKIQELYAKLSPEEKFNKMLSMCQTVREIILSRTPEGLTEIEKRKKLFIIYYKQDYSKEQFEKILKNLFPELIRYEVLSIQY